MVHIEESLQLPRDFEGKYSDCRVVKSLHIISNRFTGFGEEGFDPKWPNGAQIAVSFVLNYE